MYRLSVPQAGGRVARVVGHGTRPTGDDQLSGDLSEPGAAVDLWARALARRYDLDYLVIDRQLPMPEAYRNARFYVYRLQ